MSAVPEHMESEAQRLVQLFDGMVAEEKKEGVRVYTPEAWQRLAKQSVKMLRDMLETD